MPQVRRWIRVATRRSVLRRSLVTCGLVGTILVAVNHGDAVLRGRVDSGLAVQILLTFLVPFLVSTFSSVAAISGHHVHDGQDAPAESDVDRIGDRGSL